MNNNNDNGVTGEEGHSVQGLKGGPDAPLEPPKVDLDPWIPEDPTDGQNSEDDDDDQLAHGSFLSDLLQKLKMDGGAVEEEPIREKVLSSMDLAGVVEYIQSGRAKNVLVMAGAGISVSAGIPDFRTPGTGLYDNLQKYNLPSPESIFTLDYFKENPQAFYTLCVEMHPLITEFKPTPTHHMIKLLHDKGILRRAWTQNIDSLESKAGLPVEKLVAAHGNFDTATCITTGERVENQEFIQAIQKGEEGWQAMREKHGGLVKPDIVFFGESLPPRFHSLLQSDFEACDLLLVLGTSLSVQPFASLISRVRPECPRLLINREPAGVQDPDESFLVKLGLSRGGGFVFDGDHCYRDVFFKGDCDAGSKELVKLLGWEDDLESLIRKTN